MDESALRISLAISEMCRASLVPLLKLSNELVVVGLVLDAAVIILEYWEGLSDFWRGTIHAPAKPSISLLCWGLLGTLLIVGGVAGELLLQAKIGSIETEMRIASDRIVILVSKEAGGAQISAKGAAEQAGIAHKRAREIGKEADELLEKTSVLAKQLSDAQTAELEERRKVIELENSLAPREIKLDLNNPVDKADIDILKSFAGIKVTFEVIPDVEARRAAYEISDVIGPPRAGWKIIEEVLNPELWAWYFDGVLIEYPSPLTPHAPSEIDPHKTAERAATELEVFLISKGWEARTGPDDKMPANTLKITVGFKPERIFEPESSKASREQFEEKEKRRNDFERLHPPPLR